VTSTNPTPDSTPHDHPAGNAGRGRRSGKPSSSSTSTSISSAGPQRTAAIYARVSSARQKKDETIGSQLVALREHAATAGWSVPEQWVFEDDGHSGATLARPALERLRDLVAGIGVEVVVCYSPDRLARKFAYQALLIEEFTRAGTRVEFVKGPRGDSPEDQLMVQFQGMFAEYEKAQIMERYRRGKAHRARAGSVNVLGGAPFGYRYVAKTPHLPAAYQVIAHEAVLVRELFRRYTDDGASIADLTRWLGEQGVLTRTGKTRWDRSVVWGMLRNPAYAGNAVFGKTKVVNESAAVNRVARQAGRTSGRAIRIVDRPVEEWVHIPVPAIITPETFARAGQRLADNKRFASRNSKVPSLLQGLAACASCGYAYYRGHTTTSAGNKIYYYRCLGSDDYRYEHGRVCANKPVRADYLDQVVWDHITALLADPSLIRTEINQRLDAARTADPVVHQRKRLTDALTQATAAVNRMISAYQEELITIDELRARIPDLRARETSLRTQIDALDSQLADRQVYLKLADDLEGFLTGLRANADTADVAERQRVLRLLVKDVLIGPEKITIRHRVPVRGHTPHTPDDTATADTEGDHNASSPLRWGRDVAAARKRVPPLCPGPVGRLVETAARTR
jgi:site-specific DNA recombinase